MPHKSDRDFEAEGDAHTMARAEVIRQDKGRFERAQKAASKMLKEKKAEADGMRKLVRGVGRVKK